jgi:hypothetical protein
VVHERADDFIHQSVVDEGLDAVWDLHCGVQRGCRGGVVVTGAGGGA